MDRRVGGPSRLASRQPCPTLRAGSPSASPMTPGLATGTPEAEVLVSPWPDGWRTAAGLVTRVRSGPVRRVSRQESTLRPPLSKRHFNKAAPVVRRDDGLSNGPGREPRGVPAAVAINGGFATGYPPPFAPAATDVSAISTIQAYRAQCASEVRFVAIAETFGRFMPITPNGQHEHPRPPARVR